jgi:tripartite-type tricarboxylate transporter receptor subunit TctC
MKARVAIVAALAFGLVLPVSTRAEEWPSRPVTMLVPFAAGGPVDVAGRILAQRLTEILSRQIVVENVGGAGGMTGSNRIAKAAPDGYQFVLGNIATHAFSQSLHKKPLYDAAAEFQAVGLTIEQPRILVVRKDLPVSSLRELIAYAKANPDTLKYGSAGPGSAAHIACTLLNSLTGIVATHIPYRSTTLATQDIAAGRVDYICDVVSGTLPFIQGNAVKPIATLSPQRAGVLPQVATAIEQGLAGFDTSRWHGMFFPADTPAPIVQRLAAALNATLDTPAVRERLETLGASVVPAERRGPDYLTGFLRSEIAKWAGPIRLSGATTE